MRRMVTMVTVLAMFTGERAVAQDHQASATPAASSSSQALVERFLEALEHEDVDTIAGLLAEDVTLVMPMTFSGRIEPEFVADGRAATLAYFRTVFANFSQVRFVDPTITVGADGSRVFVEARGDFIVAQGNRAYSNAYVLRIDIADGRVAFINEYANPVTASAALGIPLGTPPPAK